MDFLFNTKRVVLDMIYLCSDSGCQIYIKNWKAICHMMVYVVWIFYLGDKTISHTILCLGYKMYVLNYLVLIPLYMYAHVLL